MPTPDLTAEIAATAAEPQTATSDGLTASSHSLPDLIEADRYLRAKAAAAAVSPTTGKRSSGFRTLRAGRAVPPGSV